MEDPPHKIKCTLHAIQGDTIPCCPLAVLLEVASSRPDLLHLVPILRRQVDDQNVNFARAVFSERFIGALREAKHNEAADFLQRFADAYAALVDRHLTLSQRDSRLETLETYLQQIAGARAVSFPGLGDRVGGLPTVLWEAWRTIISGRRCAVLMLAAHATDSVLCSQLLAYLSVHWPNLKLLERSLSTDDVESLWALVHEVVGSKPTGQLRPHSQFLS